jgi:hypothetical protein
MHCQILPVTSKARSVFNRSTALYSLLQLFSGCSYKSPSTL